VRTRIAAVFATPAARRLKLQDDRKTHPWVTGWIGDPNASVWFIGENSSNARIDHWEAARPEGERATAEDQWKDSAGDRLFRSALVANKFKSGDPDAPGGWRCYVTDLLKSGVRVTDYNKLPYREKLAIAEAWMPVMQWQLEHGRPRLIVPMGQRVHQMLIDLTKRGLRLPADARIEPLMHYVRAARFGDQAEYLRRMRALRRAANG
jgi:hypothetical protein